MRNWHLNPIKAFETVETVIKEGSVVRRWDIQLLFLQYTHFCGLIPIKYDEQSQECVINSNLTCWRLTMLTVMLGKLFQTVYQSYALITYGIPVKSVMNVLPIFFTTSAVFSGLVHLHTMWKYEEIAGLINSYRKHIQHMRQRNPSGFMAIV